MPKTSETLPPVVNQEAKELEVGGEPQTTLVEGESGTGLFRFDGADDWSVADGVRLCYRPIA